MTDEKRPETGRLKRRPRAVSPEPLYHLTLSHPALRESSSKLPTASAFSLAFLRATARSATLPGEHGSGRTTEPARNRKGEHRSPGAARPRSGIIGSVRSL